MSKMVILVTGSAMGTGRGVCASFVKQGATIVAFDVDATETKETQQAVEAAGGTCFSYTVDIVKKIRLN